jgi:hypothetical protein
MELGEPLESASRASLLPVHAKSAVGLRAMAWSSWLLELPREKPRTRSVMMSSGVVGAAVGAALMRSLSLWPGTARS